MSFRSRLQDEEHEAERHLQSLRRGGMTWSNGTDDSEYCERHTPELDKLAEEATRLHSQLRVMGSPLFTVFPMSPVIQSVRTLQREFLSKQQWAVSEGRQQQHTSAVTSRQRGLTHCCCILS